ncbi:MAG TPA: biotin--[acetyl-CoA-carboxylase] ligase [Methylomirabilota bacterium]|nr:biotin--[acetyl-CoA-carboxylase] ligase [Methylomirabilota bacterium]
MADFLARRERFTVVGSTNDVVRGWLADGTPEVCLAVADEQTAGRGREGRTWQAPAGAALLLSVGFRPAWLAPAEVWRLAAAVSLAMAEAAEAIVELPDATIRLKWPNDLVIEGDDGVRKVAGVLGETAGLGGPDPRAVIGLGLNTDWAASDFPPELAATMTSLREASPRSPVDHDGLHDRFLARLESRIEGLREGRFDETEWAERQVTTGRDIDLVAPDGAVTTARAVGVDGGTGALIVADGHAPNGERHVVVGEIRHVRLAGGTPAPARAGV